MARASPQFVLCLNRCSDHFRPAVAGLTTQQQPSLSEQKIVADQIKTIYVFDQHFGVSKSDDSPCGDVGEDQIIDAVGADKFDPIDVEGEICDRVARTAI